MVELLLFQTSLLWWAFAPVTQTCDLAFISDQCPKDNGWVIGDEREADLQSHNQVLPLLWALSSYPLFTLDWTVACFLLTSHSFLPIREPSFGWYVLQTPSPPVYCFDFWFNLNTISKLLKVTVKERWGRELPSVRCKHPVVQLQLKTRNDNICQNNEERESRVVSLENCFQNFTNWSSLSKEFAK